MSGQAPEDVNTGEIKSRAFYSLARASESFTRGLVALVIALIIVVVGAMVIAAAVASAANQAAQTVQSMESNGLILTYSQIQQIYQQQINQEYYIVYIVTFLLFWVVSYVGKSVARGQSSRGGASAGSKGLTWRPTVLRSG